MTATGIVPGRDGVGGPIKPTSIRSVSGWSIALGFIAFLGAAHILIRTSRYGVEYHNDIFVYIADAETLATGQIFERGGLAWSPPLFAAVLSLYRLLGIEPSDVGRYFNIVSFGLIVLVAGHWVNRFVRLRVFVIGTVMAIVISYPLVRISSQLLSETLFIFMTLLALVKLESLLSGRKVKFGFGLLIVFSSLAFLTRWMGFTVIVTGALLILTSRGTPTSIKWKHTIIYSVVSSLPAALWMTRNQIVNGSLTSRVRRCVTNQPLWDSLTQFGDELHLWIFGRNSFGWLDICLWAAVALAGFGAAKTLTTRSMTVSEKRTLLSQKIGTALDIKRQPVLPFVTFAIVYLVTLFVIAPYTTCEPPTAPRYLLPIYVPAAMTAAVWLESFLLKTYQDSEVPVVKSSGGWDISYLKVFVSIPKMRWTIIILILTILLVSIFRNIVLYVDILTTYDPYGYQF